MDPPHQFVAVGRHTAILPLLYDEDGHAWGTMVAQEGADYSKGADWEEHVVVDGKLVTGKLDVTTAFPAVLYTLLGCCNHLNAGDHICDCK